MTIIDNWRIELNSREQLLAAADWLGWNNEDLSYGIKSAEDALKLWKFAQRHDEWPEMADEWTSKQLRSVLGYNPLSGKHYDDDKLVSYAP